MWTEALEQPGGYLQAQTLGQERGGEWRGARAEHWAGMSWKSPELRQTHLAFSDVGRIFLGFEQRRGTSQRLPALQAAC